MSGNASSGRPIPISVREKLRRLVQDGVTVAAAARELRISRMTAYKYLGTSLDTFRSQQAGVQI